MPVEANIVDMLKKNKIAYEVIEHEPVYTNPAMAEALGVSEAETVKSLVLLTKEKRMVVLVMPGDKKVDWKKAAAGIGTKKVAFAKPEAVLEKVIKALETSVPRPRYYVTLPSYLFGTLKRCLSTRALDRVLLGVSRRERK